MSLERCRVKIAILSRDGTLYSCKRLREAAAKRGHQIEILDPMSCYMNIDPAASSIHYKGRKLPHFDAVIPRIGSQITYYGTAALRQFEMLGSYPLNESVAISRARDKLRSLQLLARQGIDLPVTGIAHSPDDTSDLIDMVGGAPLVIKLVEGTQGIGVVLAETRQAAESVIDAFRGLNAHILVQEYIEEAKGRDIRCFVVGNEVVAAIERQAKEGDFRSNLHRGGVARVADISEREREIAVKAAQTLGLDVAGVDLLRATRGPLVMEVNASPGLEGVEKTTGVDIAGKMIAWIERHATPGYCLKTVVKWITAHFLSTLCEVFTKEAPPRWIYRSFQHWIRYVNGLMMPESPSLNVIPARRCICLTCRISTAFLMPKSISLTT